jgi:hypothetical protein
MKKPYADMLYVLGVKDCDAYLPTEDEVMEMVKQAQTAMQNRQPTPAEAADIAATQAKAKLDSARADEITAEIAGATASKQLEGYALLKEHKARAFG